MKKLACLVFFALIINSTAAAFQKAMDDWSAVRALPVGGHLSVRLKDRKKTEGLLVSVSDTTLTLMRKDRTIEIAQPDIAKVYQLIPRSAGKSVARSSLIGAGIGFGVGVAAGGALGAAEDIAALETMALFGTIGAGVGAVIGAIKGLASRHRRVLIYDAK